MCIHYFRNFLMEKLFFKRKEQELLWCPVVKNPLAKAGNTSSIPGLERSHVSKSNWGRSLPGSPRPGAHALRQEKPPWGAAQWLKGSPCSPSQRPRGNRDSARQKQHKRLKNNRATSQLTIQAKGEVWGVGEVCRGADEEGFQKSVFGPETLLNILQGTEQPLNKRLSRPFKCDFSSHTAKCLGLFHSSRGQW